MKPCPECGGVMEKFTDTVEESCVSRFMRLIRVARLATFWACSSCPHCEEV